MLCRKRGNGVVKKVKQKVLVYSCLSPMNLIYRNMQSWIKDGWLVKACLERGMNVLVVYESEVQEDD